MNQALQTVGCVTTHKFNNSPPGTKAEWPGGKSEEKKEERKKYTHTRSWLFFIQTDPQHPKSCYFPKTLLLHLLLGYEVDVNKLRENRVTSL